MTSVMANDDIYAISPHCTTADYPDIGNAPVDDQIVVHADRVYGWQLDQADSLKNAAGTGQHSGFAVLSVIVSYFESSQMYLEGYVRKPGDRLSTKFLKAGLKRVLSPLTTPPTVDFGKVAVILSEDLRNGMYHESITGPRIVLKALAAGVVMEVIADGNGDPTSIRIDPHQLVGVVRADFDKYLSDLRDLSNQKLCDNFRLHFRGRKGV